MFDAPSLATFRGSGVEWRVLLLAGSEGCCRVRVGCTACSLFSHKSRKIRPNAMNELRGQTQIVVSPYKCSRSGCGAEKRFAYCDPVSPRCRTLCRGVSVSVVVYRNLLVLERHSAAPLKERNFRESNASSCPGTSSTPGTSTPGTPLAGRARRRPPPPPRAPRGALRARRESSKGPAARGCGGARLVLHICSRVRRGTKPSRGTRPCAAQPCRRPPSARRTFGTSTPSAELGCQPQRTCARSPRCSSNASTPAERNCHEQQTALALQAPNLQIFLMRCLHTWTRPLGQ